MWTGNGGAGAAAAVERFFPLSLKGNGVGGQGPEPAQSHRLGRGARTAATPWPGPQWPAGRRE